MTIQEKALHWYDSLPIEFAIQLREKYGVNTKITQVTTDEVLNIYQQEVLSINCQKSIDDKLAGLKKSLYKRADFNKLINEDLPFIYDYLGKTNKEEIEHLQLFFKQIGRAHV